jgi:hypothetical protein
MKKSTLLLRVMPFVLVAGLFQVQAAQDSTKVSKKMAGVQEASAKAAPHDVAGPTVIGGDADTGSAVAKPAATTPAVPVKTHVVPAAGEAAVPAVIPVEPTDADKPLPSLRKPKLRSDEINTVDKMQQEAAKLRAEAKTLREMSDTLNRASDDAEKKAEEANDKAEKLEDDLKEHDVHHVAQHVKLEIERLKRIIQADVERIRKLHGATAANDSIYMLQADSLDTILARGSNDSAASMDKQRRLLDEIHANSGALLEKSKEMSVKAREMEEAADDRDDLADDLSAKAKKLADEQNPLPLSKRFPLHFGFQLRFTQVKPFFSNTVDVLFLHGMNVSYSLTPHLEAGLQDITLYWQETIFGYRYAITEAPSVRYAFFPVKRFQVGATGGLSLQEFVGCNHAARLSIAPYVAVSSEIWVRNHFSISPILRLNYAAYGPYYTVALSQHSGALPQGACWVDFGIGYNFSF